MVEQVVRGSNLSPRGWVSFPKQVLPSNELAGRAFRKKSVKSFGLILVKPHRFVSCLCYGQGEVTQHVVRGIEERSRALSLQLLGQALETGEPPGWTGSEASEGLFEWPSCSPRRPQPVRPERGGKSWRERVPSVLQECDFSVGKSH